MAHLLQFGLLVLFYISEVMLQDFYLEPVTSSWSTSNGVCSVNSHKLVPGRSYKAKAIMGLLGPDQHVWQDGWRIVTDLDQDGEGRVRTLKVDFTRNMKNGISFVCKKTVKSWFGSSVEFNVPDTKSTSAAEANTLCEAEGGELASVNDEDEIRLLLDVITVDKPHWLGAVTSDESLMKQCLSSKINALGTKLVYTYENCRNDYNFICFRNTKLVNTFSPVVSFKLTSYDEIKDDIIPPLPELSSSSLLEPDTSTVMPPPSSDIEPEIFSTSEPAIESTSVVMPTKSSNLIASTSLPDVLETSDISVSSSSIIIPISSESSAMTSAMLSSAVVIDPVEPSSSVADIESSSVLSMPDTDISSVVEISPTSQEVFDSSLATIDMIVAMKSTSLLDDSVTPSIVSELVPPSDLVFSDDRSSMISTSPLIEVFPSSTSSSATDIDLMTTENVEIMPQSSYTMPPTLTNTLDKQLSSTPLVVELDTIYSTIQPSFTLMPLDTSSSLATGAPSVAITADQMSSADQMGSTDVKVSDTVTDKDSISMALDMSSTFGMVSSNYIGHSYSQSKLTTSKSIVATPILATDDGKIKTDMSTSTLLPTSEIQPSKSVDIEKTALYESTTDTNTIDYENVERITPIILNTTDTTVSNGSDVTLPTNDTTITTEEDSNNSGNESKSVYPGGIETSLWVAFVILIAMVMFSLILAAILYQRRKKQKSRTITPPAATDVREKTPETNGRKSTTFNNSAYDI